MSDTINMEKVVQRVINLLKLAGNNPSAEEAASAAAKAQEIMTQYNLDLGKLEKGGNAADGKREKSAIEGGFYKYTRDLYKAVAELNFCTHWIQEERIIVTKGNKKNIGKERWRKVHKLIGRTVNVASCRVMCEYLEGAIERVLRDYFLQEGYSHTMLFSRHAMSFREGAVANIIERIEAERERAEAERQRAAKEEKVKASHPSAAPSTSTALTLLDYTKSEEAANYDFRYGEGAWARRLANIAKWDLDYKMEEEAEECLKIFHPEQWAKEEAERQKENAKYWKRHRGGSREKEKDWSGYAAGEKAGEGISLNQQVDHQHSKAIK